MTDLPTHFTKIEKVLIEGPVPAWKACKKCEEAASAHGKETCMYGQWHPECEDGYFQPDTSQPSIPITKSDKIFRRWKVCERCFGEGTVARSFPLPGCEECPDCLNDKGESTGAKPGTAGPWEIVK